MTKAGCGRSRILNKKMFATKNENVAEFGTLLCFAVVYECRKSNEMLQGAGMSGMTKAERLEEMKRLYIQRAYSDIEMIC